MGTGPSAEPSILTQSGKTSGSAGPRLGLQSVRHLSPRSRAKRGISKISGCFDRNGYLEETFFTFSFSPIRDESGGVGGLFHPVTETTANMLGERRTRALRDLALRTPKTTSVEEVCSISAEVMAEYTFDLPFTLLYLLDETGDELHLMNKTGVQLDITGAATRVRLDQSDLANSFKQVLDCSNPLVVEHLAEQLGLSCLGPYLESPAKAILLPIRRAGLNRPAGVFVAAVSSRLPLNDSYRHFYDLIAGQLATAIAPARAYEDERRHAQALTELDRAKTAFFSNVSHEFRTPLTLILGPLEELLKQANTNITASRDEVELVYRNGLRLLRLVNALLDFSRMEAGREQAVFEPVNLAALTTGFASSFRSGAEKAGLKFIVDCVAPSELVYVDRSMWEKVVLNLLSNAFKFTFEGEIRVTLCEQGQGVELRIADTGIGIAAEELPRLFQRFHRIEGARGRTHEGTGIGLSLVRELVELHDGAVQVESEWGKGSTFRVWLPFGAAHLPSDRVRIPSGGASPQTAVGHTRNAFAEESIAFAFSQNNWKFV